MFLLPDYQNSILHFTPGEFDAFLKILRIVFKVCPVKKLFIKNSTIVQSCYYGTGKLVVDLVPLFERDDVSLAIYEADFGKLKGVRGNGDVFFILKGEKYRVTNGNFEVVIPIPTESVDSFEDETKGLAPIGVDMVLEKELDFLKKFIGRSPYIDLFIYGDQLMRIGNSSGQRFAFNALEDGCRGDPTMILRAYRFLVVPGKKVTLRIVSDGTSFYMVADTKAGMKMNIRYTERIRRISGGNS